MNKISIRSLSENEYKKYITNNNCDGKIKMQDINTWHGYNGGFSATEMSGTIPIENSQDNFMQITRPIASMTCGRYDQNVIFHNIGGYYNRFSVQNVLRDVPKTATFAPSGGDKNFGLLMPLSFRPIICYENNPKSKNIYY